MPKPEQPSPTPPGNSYEALQQQLRRERVVKLAAQRKAEDRKPRRQFWSCATLIIVLSVLLALARYVANEIVEARERQRPEPVKQESAKREKSERMKEFERKIEEIREKQKAREGAAGE